MIETENLQLILCERTLVEALLRSKSELAAILEVTVPARWPTFPEAFALPALDTPLLDPSPGEWNGYFFIDPNAKTLVGNGGFKGAPDETGIVEIGYEIAAECWNRGFATEAAQGMIDYAFAHEDVQAVIAHTLAERNASNRVLQKVGMRLTAEFDDPEDGKIWQWRINREDYLST